MGGEYHVVKIKERLRNIGFVGVYVDARACDMPGGKVRLEILDIRKR